MDRIGEIGWCRFKMEGKRRQKGEPLVVTKKWVESTSKGGLVSKRKANVQKRRKKVSQSRREIQKQER